MIPNPSSIRWPVFWLLIACTPQNTDAQKQAEPALPGIENPSNTLVQELRSLLPNIKAGQRPRSQHLKANKEPQFINRLIKESSPYLRQHAYNPINWRPFGDDAFETAQKTNRPIFLSIGYATCHWCHVMEHESFEDIEIAEFINRHFVPVKVDREERPDIDAVYMKVVQRLTGRGGWPMTTVLTPKGEAFFGGTYFPPRDTMRGRPGLLGILKKLEHEYRTKPQTLIQKAKALTQNIAPKVQARRRALGIDVIDAGRKQFIASFDSEEGGFSRAPKFPRVSGLEFVLSSAYHQKDTKAQNAVLLTLKKMARGGLYDHLAGGFHRYATDTKWLTPHFEKMLYDQAQMISIYADAYALTQDIEFKMVVDETIEYLLREMQRDDGLFFSATDADSLNPKKELEEGYYFTWAYSEFDAVLGEKSSAWLKKHFNLKREGHLEGRSILHRTISFEQSAHNADLELPDFHHALTRHKAALRQHRNLRPKPFLDDKIVFSWNAMLVSSLIRAAHATGNSRYLVLAQKTHTQLLKKMRVADGQLLRSERDGLMGAKGFLSDYAMGIQASLDLFEATLKPTCLDAAKDLQAILDAEFWDQSSGGYFQRSQQGAPLIAENKPYYDGAEPSGNAVAARNLLRLGQLLELDYYQEKSQRTQEGLPSNLARQGRAHPKLLSVLGWREYGALDVVIVGATKDSGEELASLAQKTYLPYGRVLWLKDSKENHLLPLLKSKTAQNNRATAYVCRSRVCKRPTSDPKILATQLLEMRQL